MSFLTISAFAFLALGPVVAFLYFLKLRRTEHVISTVMLWQKSIDDMRANAPFQRLRRNLLLVLQLLIIALLAVALARPFVSASPVKGRSVAILIDNSASMDVRGAKGRTRLERAKGMARDLVSQLGGGPFGARGRSGLARAMVVSFGGRAVVCTSFSDSRRVLAKAIDAIEPTDMGTSLREALTLAIGAARGAASPEVLVLSDGAFGPSARPATEAIKGVPVRYVMIGGDADNAGIVALNVRRQIEAGRGFEVFAALHNFGGAEVRTTVDLYLNGTLLDAKQVRVKARSSRAVVFRHSRDETGVLKVQTDLDDSLAADNTAYAVLGEERLTQVLLISEGNVFLEKALGLIPTVNLARAEPAVLQAATPKGHDVVVFDNCAPGTLGPGSFLFINTPPPVTGLELHGTAERPTLVDWDPTHAVTRFLSFDPVHVQKARKVRLPRAWQVLLDSTAGPLLAAYEASDRRLLYLAFDPYDSTWPLCVSFPVFAANATQWLARADEAADVETRTGRPRELVLSARDRTATILDPRGTRHAVRLSPGGRGVFAETPFAGVYEVATPSEPARVRHRFAANLLDAEESDVRPRPHLQITRDLIARSDTAVVQKEVWAWFMLSALALLLVEWTVYHHRIWV